MAVMFDFNPYSGLLLIGCAQGIVHAGLLAARARREEHLSDAFAALILLVGVLFAAQWMLGFAGWYDARDWRSTIMFYVEWNHLAALGPLIYFYLLSVTNTDFRWRRRHWWHFAPALAFVVLPAGLLLYDFGVHAALLGQPFTDFDGSRGPAMEVKHTRLVWPSVVEDVFVRLQLPVYLVVAWRVYGNYRDYLEREFANASEFALRGLRNLLLVLTVGLALAFVSEVAALLRGVQGYADVWWGYFFISVLVFAAGIQFYALDLRRTRRLRFEPTVAEPQSPPGPIPDRGPEIERWAAALQTRLAEHRDYLEPDLKLAELAARLGTNAGVLSRVVNAHYGSNFNDFLNGRRCEAFLERVRAGEHERHTLLSLALDSGFASKSTFNRAFRKRYGFPPGQAAERVREEGASDDLGRPDA